MNTTTNPQLPAYICTTRFQAAKILEILDPHPVNPKMYGLALELDDGKMELQLVHEGYMQRNWPQVGGYFLRTAAGHARYLSAEEFEQDYARVPDPQPVKLADIELLAGQQWEAPDHAPLWVLGLEWSEQELAAIRARGPVPPLQFNRIRKDDCIQKDDPFAFLKPQAEIVRHAPADSENLHAAPHYADMLPHKQGGK